MDAEEGKAALQRLMAMYFPERPTEATSAAALPAAAPIHVKPATPAEPLPDRPSIPRADQPPEPVEPPRKPDKQASEPREPFVASSAPAPLKQEPRVNARSTATRAVEIQPVTATTSKRPSPQSPAAGSRSRNPPRKPRARFRPPPPYEFPEDYSRRWWTHKMRIKERARAVRAARYATRQRTPERFKLLRLAVRELELAEKGYSEIGAAVLRGCIGGAGGFRSVAHRIGVPAESLRAAFARDKVPPSGVVRKLLAYLLTGGSSQARHEAQGRYGPGADLPT